MAKLFQDVGVRGRLFVAFFGISGFALLAAVAALIAFNKVDGVLDRVVRERIPASFASLTLSRQTERIASAAPSLLASLTKSQQKKVAGEIRAELDKLDTLLSEVKRGAGDADALSAIEGTASKVRPNLAELEQAVAARLDLIERRDKLLQQLAAAFLNIQRLTGPGLLLFEAKISQWQRLATDPSLDDSARGAATAGLGRDIAAVLPQQKAQAQITVIRDGLTAATRAARSDLPLIAFNLNRSLVLLKKFVSEFDASLRRELKPQIDRLEALTSGPDSLIELRIKELDLFDKGGRLVQDNAELSAQLTSAVDRLIAGTRGDIAQAESGVRATQRGSAFVLVGVVILSLLSSGLIVWLYVSRNLIGRLTALSSSMLAIAGGQLRTPLPAPGRDEIGQMAQALSVFRDTAVEVEENNLREIAQARQRLIDAIESISEGFAFYDADDRLQLRNARYEELLYGGGNIELGPGTPFETIVRHSVETGLIQDVGNDPEQYVQQRLTQHRNPGPPTLQQRADGTWLLISERRVAGGGTVVVFSDITKLKLREMELEAANQRIQQVADEISRKHKELEALSNKLAKYLSPQVYTSIFAGKQEVKLASQRKKLSVFFSDIVGFTETTDKMESEDLTHLLNQYLTEMARVALDHGATIDKFVGDAIVIFFGDPETRGVKADALACVTMAIAMQKRMRELAAIWRNSGVEKPLACRIGIHTGYCTVGNFGSEDRMDYTIIGGVVNLASRLEHEADRGGILISYETYVLVRDEVHCEEVGLIQLHGISDPVAAYRVIDLHSNLPKMAGAIHAELPHLKIDTNPAIMTREERKQAATRLKEILNRLSEADG